MRRLAALTGAGASSWRTKRMPDSDRGDRRRFHAGHVDGGRRLLLAGQRDGELSCGRVGAGGDGQLGSVAQRHRPEPTAARERVLADVHFHVSRMRRHRDCCS